MISIDTKRLNLRNVLQNVVDVIIDYINNEICARYQRGQTKDFEGIVSLIERRKNDEISMISPCMISVALKETNEMIGQCGLTLQGWRDKEMLEIGYLFQKAYWHKGYAAEAAIACKEYAFNVLNASTVYSIVRDTNTASQKVAVRNGMKIIDKDTKNFRYIDMDFFLYSAERTNEAQI